MFEQTVEVVQFEFEITCQKNLGRRILSVHVTSWNIQFWQKITFLSLSFYVINYCTVEQLEFNIGGVKNVSVFEIFLMKMNMEGAFAINFVDNLWRLSI